MNFNKGFLVLKTGKRNVTTKFKIFFHIKKCLTNFIRHFVNVYLLKTVMSVFWPAYSFRIFKLWKVRVLVWFCRGVKYWVCHDFFFKLLYLLKAVMSVFWPACSFRIFKLWKVRVLVWFCRGVKYWICHDCIFLWFY